jgi:hypothetical protein
MVKEFITLRHNEAEAIRQRFDITHCRNTLLTVTQHMKQEYFFKGKIVNSKLTREYCEELLAKLNVPLSSEIQISLWNLFPQPIHSSCSPSGAESFNNTNDLGRDTPLPFALDCAIKDTPPGLTAEQAIRIQRANLVARGMVAEDTPMPHALFSAKSAKPVYKSEPSLGLRIEPSTYHTPSAPSSLGSCLRRSANLQQNLADISEM